MEKAFAGTVATLILLFIFLLGKTQVLDGVEPVSQEVINQLSATLTNPYSIKDGIIYYMNTIIEGIDLATLEYLSGDRNYLRDKNYVYYGASKVEGADPGTFDLLNAEEFGYPGYARDRNHVYLNNYELEYADPETFKLITKGETYGKDKARVYLGRLLIDGADPKTFQPITRYIYSKDKNSIYLRVDVIPNSDPATFESVTNQKGETLYYKDKNHIYHLTEGVIVNADPRTFKLLGSGYSSDDLGVYYSTTSILIADVVTFRILGNNYAQDKNYLYHEGKVVFDLRQVANPFELAAKHLLDVTPKGDIAIDYIVNTYYDLTLHYGNYSQYNIFAIENKDENDFFDSFFSGLKRSSFDLAEFVPFRLTFVATNSPASSFDFPQPVGPGIGGGVVGRKLLSQDTMLVYGYHGWQEYLGPPAGMCKGSGTSIDEFIFKKVDSEWRIWEIKDTIDSWMTNNEGNTEEECRETNQDKIEKYRIKQ